MSKKEKNTDRIKLTVCVGKEKMFSLVLNDIKKLI